MAIGGFLRAFSSASGPIKEEREYDYNDNATARLLETD
jgi:hypothetical protein